MKVTGRWIPFDAGQDIAIRGFQSYIGPSSEIMIEFSPDSGNFFRVVIRAEDQAEIEPPAAEPVED